MSTAVQSLVHGEANTPYIIKGIDTQGDAGMKGFLATLGCYEGQEVTIISMLQGNYVINVNNARYSIDTDLAAAIQI
ncbi:MAG: FeoA family protein [Pseudomonadota bacterium]